MTTQGLNPDELATAARAALDMSVDRKVAAVRTLVERTLQSEQAEQQAINARAALDAAWSDALGTGWADKELRGLGLVAPGQARPRTTRKRRTGDSSTPEKARA